MEHSESCRDRLLIDSGLARPNFQAGKPLFAADLQAEQNYRLARLRQHTFYLHGSGVICGLQVSPARDPRRPWAVIVCPGMAIGPYGEEILLRESIVFDLSEELWRLPVPPAAGQPLAVGLCSVDRPGSYLPVKMDCCGRSKYGMESSRLHDGYRIGLLTSDWAPADPSVDFCSSKILTCPSCPESAYILLAKVNLPNNTNEVITLSHIHL